MKKLFLSSTIFKPNLILFFVVGITLGGCTGMNLISWVSGHTGHPSPTPSYVGPAVVLKGGMVFHENTIAGGLGNVGNPAKGIFYKGEACSHSVLWLISWGDSSIAKAMENAQIQKIHYVEYRQEATLGFVNHNFCTIVVGTRND